MVRKLSVPVDFLGAAATAGRADWAILAAQAEGAGDSVEHRHVVLTDPEASSNATVDLALFSMRSCTVRMIDQPTAPRREPAQVMEQQSCFAGVNGGYFDPDYAPVGLWIVDGQITAPPQRAR